MTPLSSLQKSDQLLISELHEDLKTAGEILSEFLCPVLCTPRGATHSRTNTGPHHVSLPNYQHILKSAGSGNTVEKTVEGAGRRLLSRGRWQVLDRDVTCPYYPHHLKLRGAQ